VSEPVTGAAEQLRPAAEGFSEPVTARHDEDTFQVPTTLPPQGVTLEQDASPPLPELARLPCDVLPAPLLPEEVLWPLGVEEGEEGELLLQPGPADAKIADASATVSATPRRNE
jgi:hypothetical protein